jgi:hypothetical protein
MEEMDEETKRQIVGEVEEEDKIVIPRDKLIKQVKEKLNN